MLGVPEKDLEYLTQCNAVRTNGSATAAEASDSNKYVMIFDLRQSARALAELVAVLIYRELLDYLSKLVEHRLAKPEHDLISKLVVEQVGNLFKIFPDQDPLG